MDEQKEHTLWQDAVRHIVALFIISIGLLIGLYSAHWTATVHHAYPATVYENGIPIRSTQVQFDGRYWGYPMTFYECLSSLPQRNQYKVLSYFVPDMVEQGDWNAVQKSLVPDQPMNGSDALSGVMSIVCEVVRSAQKQME